MLFQTFAVGAACLGCVAWALAGQTGDRGVEQSDRAVVDHVILGVSDLDRGIREFETMTGVAPVVGGRHPGAGTRNALVSLGARTYLEIMAPDPEAARKAGGGRVAFPDRLTPRGWAIGTPSVESTATRLRDAGFTGGRPSPGSRVKPDGGILRWTTLSVRLPDTRYSPFFIEWNRETQHPAATSPAGCRLEAVAIQEPQPRALADLVKTLGLEVSVSAGGPAMRIALACPKGRVEFGS